MALGCTGQSASFPPATPAATELQRQLEAALAAAGKQLSKLPLTDAGGPHNQVINLSLRVVDMNGQALPPGSPAASHLHLRWTQRLRGDFDQNGEVSLSDLVPLGQHFKHQVAYDQPELHDGFTCWPTGSPTSPPQGNPPVNNWRMAEIDGDGNGEINAADIATLAQHWGEQLDGYVIERGVNRGTGGLEWDPLPINLGAGSYPSAASPNGQAGLPLAYSALVPLQDAELEQSFRLRIWSQSFGSSQHVAAEAHYLPNVEQDLVAPLWQGPPGLQALIPHDGQLQAVFGTAQDAQSPPVLYRVYWQAAGAAAGSGLDYTAAESADCFASPFTITGLDNSQIYLVAVRALDSAVPPNQELNNTVAQRQPGPRDIYPPQWTGPQPGIGQLIYGNGLAVVCWNEAVDLSSDQFGEWSSGPANYRIYHGPGSEPDWQTAEQINIGASGNSSYVRIIQGIDCSQPHWFAVRSFDRAEFPNEDANTHFVVGWPSLTFDTGKDLPGAGPTVESPLFVSRSARFAYTPTRDAVRLCIESYTSSQRWVSLYRIETEGFVHEQDLAFAELAAHPLYRLHAVGLDPEQRLRLLYTSSRQFGGTHVLYEYSAASGESKEHVVSSGPDLLSAEYGPDGELHAFWLELVNSDLEHLEFVTYYSSLPYTTDRPVYKVTEGEIEQYLTIQAQNWAWLPDGSCSALGVMTPIDGSEPWKAIVTVPPEGTPRIGHAAYPFLSTGTSTYKLAARSHSRAILCDWGISTSGVPVAQLRMLKDQLSLGNEAGLTQQYLAHPEHGPAQAVLDWSNFAMARTLSTTIQSGMAGAAVVYRCIHGSSKGRQALIPLPQLAAGEHVYPVEFLPGSLVLCYAEGDAGRRVLLLDLDP